MLATVPSITILHVEDNLLDAKLFYKQVLLVDQYNVNLVRAKSIQQAEAKLQEQKFDLIFLDLYLPDSHGFSTIKDICDNSIDMPVIVLTGSNDEQLALDAIAHGAQDFLLKGEVESGMLSRSIRYAIDRKKAEVKMKKLAQNDTLTGLANRALFDDRLEQSMLRVGRNNSKLALLFIDLDKFKHINDNYGHDIGDALLKEVANRLRQTLRNIDTVARLGGDEFVVIIENISDKSSAADVASNIVDMLSKPYQIDGHELFTSASIGISIYTSADKVLPKDLCKFSDIAMYEAKRNGRNNYLFFSEPMVQIARNNATIENDLFKALLNKEFFLEYQPLIDSDSGKMIGAEALLRWKHPVKGVVQPNDFISFLEDNGQIVILGEWVIKHACQQWVKWIEMGKIEPSCVLSINLSAKQFRERNLCNFIQSILEKTGLKAYQLDLEITENSLLENDLSTKDTIEKLRHMGISLSIDDFGTGYSSLAFLKDFPLNRLKIDKSFITNILDKEKDAAIAASIISLAGNLDLEVVVEGVDEPEKLEYLVELGCHQFQGFHFSKPMSANTFPQQFSQLVLH